MKTILDWRTHGYLARVSVFLIVIALVAGMIGCSQSEPEYTPMVAVGTLHTVGLKSDGTVIALVYNDFAQ